MAVHADARSMTYECPSLASQFELKKEIHIESVAKMSLKLRRIGKMPTSPF